MVKIPSLSHKYKVFTSPLTGPYDDFSDLIELAGTHWCFRVLSRETNSAAVFYVAFLKARAD